MAEDLVTMFYEKPVTEWAQVLDTVDLPHVYFITFAALISTVFSLTMPFWIASWLITLLSDAIIPKEAAQFIQGHYLPELGEAVKDISLSFSGRLDLLRKFSGMLLKILYAFMWQEFFVPLGFLYNPVGLWFGATLMPAWNWFASGVSGFP